MSGRRTRVWRVEVAYPDAGPSLEVWEALCEERGWRTAEGCLPFRWPSERLYLSKAGALARVKLLEQLGATAHVVRSLPVEWPEDSHET